jgi:hypothetical protein
VFIFRYIIFFIAAVISFWLAEKVIADNRIAPQELIDHLFGEGIHEVPLIAMVKASGNIHDPEKPVEAQAQAPGFTAPMALMVLAVLTITLTIIGSYKKQ